MLFAQLSFGPSACDTYVNKEQNREPSKKILKKEKRQRQNEYNDRNNYANQADKKKNGANELNERTEAKAMKILQMCRTKTKQRNQATHEQSEKQLQQKWLQQQ